MAQFFQYQNIQINGGMQPIL